MTKNFSNYQPFNLGGKLALFLGSVFATAATDYGFVHNENFSGIDFDKDVSISPEWNVIENLSRNIKFDKPPSSVQKETLHDEIVDGWEQSQQCIDLAQ